jgi:enamine deaminase RidA (YjgF/YER057c/UK114 family)
VIAPDGRTVYIAGQVAFDSSGQVVGEGDFTASLARAELLIEIEGVAVLGSIVRQ